MILADTSAWVEYDRATGSPVDLRLAELIAAEGPIAVTEPVIMEVLAAARTDARQADLRRFLQRFHLYQFDPAADFEGAARIYRRCRRAGITPRGLVDCMIAAVAWRHRATLLACDADLDRVARVIGIELDNRLPSARSSGASLTVQAAAVAPRSVLDHRNLYRTDRGACPRNSHEHPSGSAGGAQNGWPHPPTSGSSVVPSISSS